MVTCKQYIYCEHHLPISTVILPFSDLNVYSVRNSINSKSLPVTEHYNAVWNTSSLDPYMKAYSGSQVTTQLNNITHIHTKGVIYNVCVFYISKGFLFSKTVTV